MGFRVDFVKILARVLLLILWVYGMVYTYLTTELMITPVMFALLMFLSVVELSWFLQRQERSWIGFLESIRYQDFNRTYKKQASKELSDAYELISQGMEELQSNNQAEYRLLQMVLGHISIGVVCYREDGHVIFTNKSFDALLDIPALIHMDRLKIAYPLMYEVMTQTEASPTGWIDHRNGQKLFVKTESFKLKGINHQLASFTDIRSSLDTKELESYQKLMRVMTHEIMNSANPILSLIKVINKQLIEGDTLNQPDARGQRNIATSLLAIEERTSGILMFVSAYKEINRPLRARMERISSKDLLGSIDSLMQQASDIELVVKDHFNEYLVIDLSLINQVLINLIKNAIEAINGTPDGKITVIMKREANHAIIAVIDNGPGVPHSNLHQLFVPFYTTKANGSGIGLALSRKIVKAHGGTLEYERADEGTHFVARLPMQ